MALELPEHVLLGQAVDSLTDTRLERAIELFRADPYNPSHTALALALVRTFDRALDLDFDLERAFDRALARALVRVLDLGFAFDLALAYNRALGFDRAFDRALALAFDLDLALAFDLDLALAYNRAHTFDRARLVRWVRRLTVGPASAISIGTAEAMDADFRAQSRARRESVKGLAKEAGIATLQVWGALRVLNWVSWCLVALAVSIDEPEHDLTSRPPADGSATTGRSLEPGSDGQGSPAGSMSELVEVLTVREMTDAYRVELTRRLESVRGHAQILYDNSNIGADPGSKERVELALAGLRVELRPRDDKTLVNPARAISFGVELAGYIIEYERRQLDQTDPAAEGLAAVQQALGLVQDLGGIDADSGVVIAAGEALSAVPLDLDNEPAWLADDGKFTEFAQRNFGNTLSERAELVVSDFEELRARLQKAWLEFAVWATTHPLEVVAEAVGWVTHTLGAAAHWTHKLGTEIGPTAQITGPAGTVSGMGIAAAFWKTTTATALGAAAGGATGTAIALLLTVLGRYENKKGDTE